MKQPPVHVISGGISSYHLASRSPLPSRRPVGGQVGAADIAGRAAYAALTIIARRANYKKTKHFVSSDLSKAWRLFYLFVYFPMATSDVQSEGTIMLVVRFIFYFYYQRFTFCDTLMDYGWGWWQQHNT